VSSPLPGNVDIVRVRGYWFDQDGGGAHDNNNVPLTVTFAPFVSNLTDAAAFSYIKTDTIVVTPNPTTAYFYADLIASNDPDLTPSAWTITLQGQPSVTVGIDYNASVQDVGAGVMMKAVWLTDAAPVSPPPAPINSYYTSVQTNAAIAEALDGFTGTSAVTSVSGRTGDVVLVEGDITGLVTDLAAKVAKSTFTTKGDTLAASSSATPVRVAVGSNNQILTADSAQTAGVKWADPAPTGVTSVTALDSTTTVAGTTTVTVGVNAIPESKVTNLVSDLAGKQPLDSDLTTIAGLTATTDNTIMSVGSAWASRTPAQVKTTLAIAEADVSGLVSDLAAKQPLDSDLTTIAGLTATTDNFMVANASAWASRTPAQAKVSLALTKTDVGLSNVDNTSNVTERAAAATLTNKTLTSPVITSPTGIVASDVGAQPVDSDLTTIAGLTATTDNVIQSVAGAWASRTPAQHKATLALVESDISGLVTDLAAKQPLDSDLTTIAGLTATTDNVIMSVGSAWASRTPAQVKTTLAIVESDVTSLVADLAAKVPLSTVTTKGDVLAATGSATLARLAAGSNNQVLTVDSSTATGLKWAAAAAGSVSSVTAGDSTVTMGGTATDPTVKVSAATLATLAPVASPSFTGTATFAKQVSTPVALTDAATIAVDASLGNLFRVTLGGNRTMGAPSTPSDGQMVSFEILQDGTGSRTLTWTSGAGGFQFDAPTPTLSTTAGARDFLRFSYNTSANRWIFAVSSAATGTIAETQVTNLTTDLAAKAPLASPTFTGTVSAAKVVSAPVALTDAATIAVDAALGNTYRVTLGGNRTMGAPTNATDGQIIVFELLQDATGSRLVTWTSGSGGFAFDTVSAPALSTVATDRDYVSFVYNSTSVRWQYLTPPTPSWVDRVETLTDGASVTPNAANGLVQAGIWTCATATPTLFAPANPAQGQPYRVIINASAAQRVITLSGFVASTDDPTTAVTIVSGKWASLYFEYIAAIGWMYCGKKGN